MNHVYRVIFNHSLGVYQCVSELAKSRGKSSGKSQVATKLILAPLTISMLGLSGTAMAVTYDDGKVHVIDDNPYVISEDVIVSGKGTEIEAKFPTIVGKDGNGKLTLVDDGVLNTFTLTIGQNEGANGEVLIKDKSRLYLDDTLTVGDAGKGLFTLKNDDPNAEPGGTGTLLIYKDAYIGNKSTGDGKVVIDGDGADVIFRQNVYVGNEGTGNFTVKNIGVVNIEEALIVGSKLGSKNNLVEVSTPSRSGPHSFINASKIIIGDAGEGALKISTSGSVRSNSDFIVANQTGSSGSLNLDNGSVSSKDDFILANGDGTVANVTLSADSRLRSDKNIIIANGVDSVANVNLEGDSSVSTFSNDIVIGKNKGAVGNVTLSASRLNSANMIVGQQGNGTLNVNNEPDSIGKVSISDTTYVGGFGENAQEAKGALNINNASFRTGNLVIGNTGSGVLKASGIDSYLSVKGIERNIASKQSDIYLDGTTVEIKADQPNLFANFTKDNIIQLGNKGVVFDTEAFVFSADKPDEYIATDVVINPNAVITGNVGKISFKDGGGFVKTGSGNLEFSMSSKQWTGDLGVAEGTLKINGDYSMAKDETLTIGVYDNNSNGIIDNNEYGKLIVNGNIDISEGDLYVYAEDISKVKTDNLIKDVIKANTRRGEFRTVSDNSPLVSFYADYSNPNAVNLKMGITPVVVPPVVVPPVVTPPVVTPPVVTPPVVIPPVVTPPVVTPPVVTPPVVTPPVVTPPVVTPPVVTPPVVTPPVVDTTFAQSVLSQFNRNDLSLAYVLDRAIQDRVANGNNDLADDLISSTINFNQSQLAAAANQLQPLFMGATNRIITDTNYAVSEAVTEHRTTTLERNLWAKIIGNNGTHEAENGITGYETEGYGAIVGLDTPINSNLNLGVAVSYINTDANTDGSNLDHDLTAKNWQILGYGNYAASEATNVNFHAGAGSSDVKGERNLSILTNAVATSDYSVDTLQAGVGVGHRVGTEQRHITPFAQFNYAQAKSDSYQETGAGVYNLNVDENKYESMRWTAGLRLSQLLTPKLALTGQLAAAIENGDQHSDITASFIGMPNDKFTTVGQEVGREIGIAGIGLSYSPTANMKISAGYRGEWRDNYDEQGASIALQTTF
ncbi:autotransporter domain-containing protein [Psychrobacter cryohalolentis]|uniref:autotransporter outer membrane beta-barrel domain-containing protein n=1 Tax=Psychrobacter sp. D2 TaxID=2759702 RepID=UPI0015E5D8AC|nr:autotransporter outer membrane beta-barrel domain-containing protein [Psychrobacter sp. D2]MBA2056448.1 autotransporter domain-containing protein [Psychrobacter sp. D2]